MLTNRQIFTLFTCNDSKENCARESWLPEEVARIIAFDQASTKAAAMLLHYVAYGELTKAEEMIKADPALLLQASDVVTRSGLLVKRVTPYECALGAGDPECAAMMAPYFAKIQKGEQERAAQYERYKPAINGMMNELDQTEKDKLETLIEIIKGSANNDVTAALLKDMSHGSLLRDALCNFRDDVRPKEVTQPEMHYNYQRLIYAFNLLDREWTKLNNGNNYDKCDLVWRQVIGYLQRGLPAVDRFAFAKGLYDLVENHGPVVRNTDFKYGGGSFSDTLKGDSDFSGVGFDYGIDGRAAAHGVRRGWHADYYKLYVEQKHQTCRTYAATPNKENSVCNLLR
jgi:hypothetical protein